MLFCIIQLYTTIYIDIVQNLFTTSIGISFQFNSFQFIVGLSISKLEILQFIVSTSNIFQNTPKHSKTLQKHIFFVIIHLDSLFQYNAKLVVFQSKWIKTIRFLILNIWNGSTSNLEPNSKNPELGTKRFSNNRCC